MARRNSSLTKPSKASRRCVDEIRPPLIGYLRVSTDEQANAGVSLDAQRTRIEAYATALNYRVLRNEKDHLSGKLQPDKRPGLARALEAVRIGEATGIIVFRLDRLSRSTVDVLRLADEARREGWQLLSVCERLDTSTAAGMAQVAREGRARSWKLPFGYRIEGEPELFTLKAGDKRRLVPHPNEQRILKRILSFRAQGYGACAIATRLKRAGIRKPRTGKVFSEGGIRSFFRTVASQKVVAKQSGKAAVSFRLWVVPI